MLSVDGILTHLFATHTNILTSLKSTVPYKTTSTLRERSPTPHIAVQPKLRLYA